MEASDRRSRSVVRMPFEADPYRMLVALRDRPGLFGLIGHWAGGGALIGFEPVETLADGCDPFDAFVADRRAEPVREDLLVGGGWFGTLGFGLSEGLERYPPDNRPQSAMPRHHMARYDLVLRQRKDGHWYLEGESTLDPSRVSELEEKIRLNLREARHRDFAIGEFSVSPQEADQHRQAVRRAIAHIAAGDIFQVNVCMRLRTRFEGDPIDAFCRAGAELRPARAAFFRVSHQSAVASLSPELFLERHGDRVRFSPIKGTARRSGTESQQQLARRALAGSSKDRAENIIIVDLMRNDAAKIAKPGSVRVDALNRIEPHPGVWHLVSDVVGQPSEDISDGEMIRSTFPPGSITGAPKKRAVEVINQLEVDRRGMYTGAIGFSSPAWGLELSVAIRTFEFVEGEVHLGVGGGITTASDPDLELAECETKAAPLVTAVGSTLRWPPAGQREPEVPTHLSPPTVRLAPDSSYGVFTTAVVEDGVVVDLSAHQDRLSNSAQELYGAAVPDIAALLSGTLPQRGRYRLRITATPDHSSCHVETALSPLPLRTRPLVLEPVVAKEGLGKHKWQDRRDLDALRRGAEAEDIAICDEEHNLLESSRHNLFAVFDDRVITAPLDGRVLPGTARARVVAAARRYRIPVFEADLSLAELRDRTCEMFATNALDGVRPVREIEGFGRWKVGPVTMLLRTAIGEASAPRLRVPRSGHRRPRVLVIDNYDSFVYNLVDDLRQEGLTVEVVRNDEVTVREVSRGGWDGILMSPGPGRPAEAGICEELVRLCGAHLPILGVCLGHQAIVTALGGEVVRSPRPQHGRASIVAHDGEGVLAGLPSPMAVSRYHSLIADRSRLPSSLRITAWTADRTVMGVAHRHWDLTGVQFHPESILTPWGHELITNFARQVRTHADNLTSRSWVTRR